MAKATGSKTAKPAEKPATKAPAAAPAEKAEVDTIPEFDPKAVKPGMLCRLYHLAGGPRLIRSTAKVLEVFEGGELGVFEVDGVKHTAAISLEKGYPYVDPGSFREAEKE